MLGGGLGVGAKGKGCPIFGVYDGTRSRAYVDVWSLGVFEVLVPTRTVPGHETSNGFTGKDGMTMGVRV